MIEGGGLGIFRPEEIGPIDVQVPNGVVDIAVADEAEAVRVAKKYLSYFQGAVGRWECADQRLLRDIIPENRLRIYDVRAVIETLADTGSVLELRRHFGLGMVTALIRIEGRPFGVDREQSRRIWRARSTATAPTRPRASCNCATRSTSRCCFCATRPASWSARKSRRPRWCAMRRGCSSTGANVTRAVFHHRAAQGLRPGRASDGRAAVSRRRCSRSRGRPASSAAWDSRARSSSAIATSSRRSTDPAKRKKLFDEMVARMYQHGKAVNSASHFEIDDVIDPLESRRWIMAGLALGAAARAAHRQKAPVHRYLVNGAASLATAITHSAAGAFRLLPLGRSG